jgi:hypothetical protein
MMELYGHTVEMSLRLLVFFLMEIVSNLALVVNLYHSHLHLVHRTLLNLQLI